MTGQAATKVMTVLKPHFEKEEKFALPQLGALEILKPGALMSPETAKDLIALRRASGPNCLPCWKNTDGSRTALGEMEKSGSFREKGGHC